MEHDDDDNECDCVGCQISRQMRRAVDSINAQGAANARRGMWMDVFMEKIRQGSFPSDAARFASQSVIEMDKVFPEVKQAAMTEDR